jgi:two-component system, OmpR family, sensor histidine kinase KdpD
VRSSSRLTDRGRLFGLGEPHVNVLNLNLALDAARPPAKSCAPAQKGEHPARSPQLKGMTEQRRDSEHRALAGSPAGAAREGGRGRLKIFVGAAPGVGKTYEMLQARAARKKASTSSSASSRPTAASKPRRCSKGSRSSRAAHRIQGPACSRRWTSTPSSARRPQLVLVDELAHTNAPGSRHPKRYLDVEELLGAGIDVYTTLNIQHIESLNDVVAQITRMCACARPCRIRRVRPRRRHRAVDLTPDDLIQRLKEGKVYVPATGRARARALFLAGNLTALRELALRRTAERVDEQMLTEYAGARDPGPWAPASASGLHQRGSARGGCALRQAARRPAARALDRALCRDRRSLRSERGASATASPTRCGWPSARRRGRHHSGGERASPTTSSATRTPTTSPRSSSANRGARAGSRSCTARWCTIWSAARQYQRPRHRRRPTRGEQRFRKRRSRRGASRAGFDPSPMRAVWRWRSRWRSASASNCSNSWFGVEHVDLVFLTAVVGARSPMGCGRRCSPAASACCATISSFCRRSTPSPSPIRKCRRAVLLHARRRHRLNLAARVRTQASRAQSARKGDRGSLYSFSRKLAGAGTLDDVLWATAYQIALMLKVRVVLLLPEGERLDRGARRLSAGGHARRRRSRRRANGPGRTTAPAGRGSDTLPGAKRLFLPMRTGRGAIGVIGIDSDKPGPLLTPDQRRLLDALAIRRAGDRARATGRGHGPRERTPRPSGCARRC